MAEIEVFKNCPVEHSLKFLGKKWTFNILRDLFFGPQKYSSFLEANNGLTSKILAKRLRDLETIGLIVKHENGNHKKTLYEITPKGRKVSSILTGLADYSIDFHPENVITDGFTQNEARNVVRTTFTELP